VRWLAGLGLMMLTAIAFAEEHFEREEELMLLYGDEESVSIATGSSKPVRLAPSVATVITASDIEAIGATDLDEALEMVPGLHVSKSFNRLNSIFSIRGIHTGQNPQVLLLLDGVPMTELFTGGRAPTFRMPVAGISRVEVIRGPGSAVYGADAFAGVINIIPKSSREIGGTRVGLRKGSFDSRDAWLQYGGTPGGWDVAFNLEYNRSDGDRDRRVGSDMQTTLDAAFGTSASLAPGPLDTDYEILNTRLDVARGNWKVGMWAWIQDGAGIGPGGAQALDPYGKQDVNQYLADAQYGNADIIEDWDLGVRLSYQYLDDDTSFKLFPPGTRLPIGADGNVDFMNPAGIVDFPDGLIGKPGGTGSTTALESTARFSGLDRHSIRLAAGYKYQQGRPEESKNFGPGVIDGTVSPIDGTLTDVSNTPYVFMEDEERKIWFVSLQDEWAFASDWELTAGVRYDHYSDFGSTVNPRLALVWATLRNLTTRFMYGRAFRAPSFGEEFTINNPVILGNPDLDPETIDTLELAFDYRPTFNLQTGLNLFYYEIDDAIEFVPDPPPATTNTAQNSRDQEGYGFELEAYWQPSEKLRLGGNYAMQYSEDKDTGDRIADAPRQQIYLDARWSFLPDWSFDTQLVSVGDRKRAAGDARSDIDDYTLVNVTLRRRRFAKHWELAASVRNLFDEDASEPSTGAIPDDYPLAERSVYAELSYFLKGDQ
jgi:iron complex outermembrane receptor protein